MFGFVFAFHLKRSSQADIFEYNHEKLNGAIEELSSKLEKELVVDGVVKHSEELKFDLLNRTAYCESLRKKLLDHVQEGYAEDFWEFVELD